MFPVYLFIMKDSSLLRLQLSKRLASLDIIGVPRGALLKPLGPSQQYRIERFMGVPIIPRDGSLSDSGCNFFSVWSCGISDSRHAMAPNKILEHGLHLCSPNELKRSRYLRVRISLDRIAAHQYEISF